jgi:hypothetical protein
MHLPFMQVASEILDITAPEVAIALDWSEEAAFTGLVRLFRWGLARCPDHLPPSASDTIKRPTAAKLIARATGYTGDAEAFVSACESAAYPVLERVPDGIRLRGLNRYDAAWGKNNPALWAEWKRSRAGTGPKPARNRAETVPPYADTDSDLEVDSTAAAGQPPVANPLGGIPTTQEMVREIADRRKPEAAPRAVITYQEPTTEPSGWSPDEFHAWAQVRRSESGYFVEKPPNVRDLGSWYSEALMSLEGRVDVLQEAFFRFGESKHWETAEPPYPFKAFMSQWRRFVPKRAV